MNVTQRASIKSQSRRKLDRFCVRITMFFDAKNSVEACMKALNTIKREPGEVAITSVEPAFACALDDIACTGDAVYNVPTYGILCEHHYAQAIRINYSLSDIANLRAE